MKNQYILIIILILFIICLNSNKNEHFDKTMCGQLNKKNGMTCSISQVHYSLQNVMS